MVAPLVAAAIAGGIGLAGSAAGGLFSDTKKVKDSEIGYKGDATGLLKALRDQAQNSNISRQEGDIAANKTQANMASAIKGTKGLGAGLQQREIINQGRKLQGQNTANQMVSALKERRDSITDSTNLVNNLRNQDLKRAKMNADIRTGDKDRRQKVIGSIAKGFGNVAKVG